MLNCFITEPSAKFKIITEY